MVKLSDQPLLKILVSSHNRSFGVWFWAGGFAIALNWMGDFCGDILYPIFALPAAQVAGFFFNSPPVFDETGLIIIPLAASLIQVTPDCSGYGFFCLITAIFVIFYRDIKWRIPLPGRISLTLLTAYLITIITNGFRIVSGFKTHLIIMKFLPSSAQNLVHLVVGVTIFLTVLLFVYLVMAGKVYHDRTRA